MSPGKRRLGVRALAAVSVAAIAVFVLVATVVEAVRQGSWAPIWQVGWLPAVLLASFYGSGRDRWCLPRVRGRTRP